MREGRRNRFTLPPLWPHFTERGLPPLIELNPWLFIGETWESEWHCQVLRFVPVYTGSVVLESVSLVLFACVPVDAFSF